MKFRNLQANWDAFGRTDPLWSILTVPEKRHNKWDLAQFLETGEQDVEELLGYLRSLGVDPRTRKALDFGCGVGRVTQALAARFEEVFGVDIASSMIELALKHNRRGNACKYLLNNDFNLSLFASDTFDLVFSYLTLQHIEPRYTKLYLKEFLRVLAPGGLLIFQLPSGPSPPSLTGRPDGTLSLHSRVQKRARMALDRLITKWQRFLPWGNRRTARPIMEMYGIERVEVEKLLITNGGILLDVREDGKAGRKWISLRYCVRKQYS